LKKKKKKWIWLEILVIYLDEVAAKAAAHTADCYKEAYTSAKAESAKKVIPEVSLEIL
jgi:hypothetical protein